MRPWDVSAEIKYHSKPFEWIKINRCFDPADAVELTNTFPTQGFVQSIGKESRYSLYERVLIDHGQLSTVSDLSVIWASFGEYMLSREYKNTIENITRRKIENGKLRVRLYRYESGDWMNPHTDPPDRLTTHLIYLNTEWKKEYGGQLVFLNSNSLDSIVEIVQPSHNSGVIFCPSASTFHAVSPMAKNLKIERIVVIAQFVQESFTDNNV